MTLDAGHTSWQVMHHESWLTQTPRPIRCRILAYIGGRLKFWSLSGPRPIRCRILAYIGGWNSDRYLGIKHALGRLHRIWTTWLTSQNKIWENVRIHFDIEIRTETEEDFEDWREKLTFSPTGKFFRLKKNDFFCVFCRSVEKKTRLKMRG